jgi:hypothetical protein
MATEKQIAANRRNAKNSTGPRSASGKKRASGNAYRHGLSTRMPGAEFTRAVELLARQIAGNAAGPMALAVARNIADAILELARVRRATVALIARVSAFGRLDAPKIFASKRDEVVWVAQHFLGLKLRKNPAKFAADDLPEMPTEEPQRTAEAVRRALPSLLKLQRFEARAAARRDEAIRTLVRRKACGQYNL